MVESRPSIDEFQEIVWMLNKFAQCRMYSVIDRLANATGREAVYTSLYEALRMSIAAKQRGDGYLCNDELKVSAYVAPENVVKKLLDINDDRILVELAKKIAIASLTPYRRKEKEV